MCCLFFVELYMNRFGINYFLFSDCYIGYKREKSNKIT